MVSVNGIPVFEMKDSWQRLLAPEFSKPYFIALQQFLRSEKGEVYPPLNLIFNAFSYTLFERVKVVIIGQDPYHGPNQAHGLCFSVPPGIAPPPSLVNIFLELKRDLQIPSSKQGCLIPWAEQGVFLLNTVLTVRARQAQSHSGKGWEQFTDAVIEKLVQREDPLVFVLWGKAAQKKLALILKGKETLHTILTAPHPSPLSAYQGFLGCGHFSKVNRALEAQGKAPIDWSLGEK